MSVLRLGCLITKATPQAANRKPVLTTSCFPIFSSGTNISIYSDNLVDVNILVGLHRSKAIEYNVRAYEDVRWSTWLVVTGSVFFSFSVCFIKCFFCWVQLPRLPSLFGSPGGGDIVCVTMDQKLTDFNITKLAQRYEIPIPEEGLQSSFIYLTASGPTTQVFRRIEPLQFPVLLNSMGKWRVPTCMGTFRKCSLDPSMVSLACACV